LRKPEIAAAETLLVAMGAGSAKMRSMTFILVMGGLAVVMVGGVTLFLVRVVPRDEQAIARANAESDAARERDAAWHATESPEDCPHDDVAEDWDPAPARPGGSIFGSAVAVVENQGGICQRCGAEVVRHGRPGAWTDWELAPTGAAAADSTS
jgi:hypothetical protein